MRFVEEFRDPAGARGLAAAIAAAAGGRSLTIMEVCGGHTHAVARFGLRDLLPPGVRLVSGPGCPVCVTPVGYVDRAVALARLPDVTVATFGDMVRVPGSRSTLEKERGAGARVLVCTSPREALETAAREPGRRVVFLGVGFETTAPGVAAAVLEAAERKVGNFLVLCGHKTMPAVMRALVSSGELRLDAFLCPGHVTTVTGPAIYDFLAREFAKPCAVSGFEPTDILEAVLEIVRMAAAGAPAVRNAYLRSVRPEGNPRARAVLERVFTPCDGEWRGVGVVPGSGLRLRPEFAAHDAERIPVELPPPREAPKACLCGDILRGAKAPADCPAFAKGCTPKSPVGPCMVSSEGACAAAWRYGAA